MGEHTMCKIVGLAVAAAIAASGSTWCTRPSDVAATSEAVPATVKVLPLDILQSQLGVLLFKRR
jgi:hypothetical protein